MEQPLTVFITGIAGFIGYHLAKHLQGQGANVMGCDHFSDYYSPQLKRERAEHLQLLGVSVLEHDLLDLKELYPLFEQHKYSHFIHLAAQPGVRLSLSRPHLYVKNNVDGFLEVLELCRRFQPMQLIYASSSSVYGLNTKIPFAETDPISSPASLYAATKHSNELMAHTYHHLFKIPAIGLRFFTVYGPWGRPDMAYFSFTEAIDEGRPISVFNHGEMQRDFTYIDDIIQGCVSALHYKGGHEIFNLGNHTPEPLLKLVHLIEKYLGKKALIEFQPMQPGDVVATWADVTKSQRLLGYTPSISLEEGMRRFIEWYQQTYSNKLASDERPLADIQLNRKQ